MSVNRPENQSVGCGCALMAAGGLFAALGVANLYLSARDAGRFVFDTRGSIAAALGAFVLVTGAMMIARRLAAGRSR